MNTGPAAVILAAVVAAATCLLPAHAFASCDGQRVRSGPITLDVGSDHRLFVLHVPSSADGRTPRPVLFAFHPFGMNAQYMQSRVSSRFWPDAILVYPEGLSQRGAGPSWQGRPGESGDRDLQFFDAMLAWLAANTCADAGRVFVMGYSNGAALANVIACARGQRIAGAAMASGRLACQPAAPLPVIVAHGLRDATVSYNQAIAASQAWSTVNGCAAPPRAGAPGCAAAQSCASAPMTLCTHAGGHEYSATFTRSMMEFFQQSKP